MWTFWFMYKQVGVFIHSYLCINACTHVKLHYLHHLQFDTQEKNAFSKNAKNQVRCIWYVLNKNATGLQGLFSKCFHSFSTLLWVQTKFSGESTQRPPIPKFIPYSKLNQNPFAWNWHSFQHVNSSNEFC